jgi:hypothetical protein
VLHMSIYKTLLESKQRGGDASRRTLVLATGDAAASEFNPDGFHGASFFWLLLTPKPLTRT